jgi:hypothetical protein
MMAAVARYGLLSSEQIARMDGGSRQKCTRFLQQLVELKLLRLVQSTPTSLRKSFFDVRPHVFAITQSGLDLLAEAGTRPSGCCTSTVTRSGERRLVVRSRQHSSASLRTQAHERRRLFNRLDEGRFFFLRLQFELCTLPADVRREGRSDWGSGFIADVGAHDMGFSK